MKKKLNILFFGVCFLAAILAEVYCIRVLENDLFSIIAIGFVVLITGYLFMDSIRSTIIQWGKDTRFFFDRMYREETDKWNNRYTETVNLQKATYIALKKNSTVLSEQLKEVLLRMNELEENYNNEIHKITELQRKVLEGQKNALNLEINYNRENTKQLIHALREEGDKTDQKELLQKIWEELEINNTLLQEQLRHLKDLPVHSEMFDEDFYAGPEAAAALDETEETASSTSLYSKEETGDEAVANNEAITVTPLYSDPNKELSADEIASLFASFGQ